MILDYSGVSLYGKATIFLRVSCSRYKGYRVRQKWKSQQTIILANPFANIIIFQEHF